MRGRYAGDTSSSIWDRPVDDGVTRVRSISTVHAMDMRRKVRRFESGGVTTAVALETVGYEYDLPARVVAAAIGRLAALPNRSECTVMTYRETVRRNTAAIQTDRKAVVRMPGRLRQCPCCHSRNDAVPVYRRSDRAVEVILNPSRYGYCKKCGKVYFSPLAGDGVRNVTGEVGVSYDRALGTWMLVD
jgi:hypothetical protein